MTVAAAAPTISRRRFSVDEYHRMAEVGILHEDDRTELIEGEIIEMAAHGGQHIRCVTVLNRLLVVAVSSELFVSPQNSVRLTMHSEPEPDFAILRALPEGTAPPPSEDVLLLTEVADTTLLYDLNVKALLYARAGVPEFWVVDLNGARVVRHTEPRDGRYTRVDELRNGDDITSSTDPPFSIAIADIFA